MRILYLINYAGKAGTEKYVRELVTAYHGTRAECYFAYNVAGLLSQQMAEAGIPSLQLKMRHPADLIAAAKLARYCRKNRIDLIHAQYPRENFIALLSRLFYRRPRVIFTSHLTLETGRLWRLANRIFTRHNAAVLAVCNRGKELLIRNGVPESRIRVIFNGVDPTPPENASTLRAELGLPENCFVAVTLARFSPEKGLDFLVDSVSALVRRTDRPFALAIAGDGELFEPVCARIRALGLENVVYPLGYRTDPDNLLAGADLFVNSARDREALSFAILEAMRHGLPVIATDVGGNSDAVGPETGSGLLVPYGDTEAMAGALARMMTEPELRAGCSASAREAVEHRFNRDRILNEIFRVCREAVPDAGRTTHD